MIQEWFRQGWSLLFIFYNILFIGIGILVGKVTKTKVGNILILLIPCILIILCEIGFWKFHNYFIEISSLLVGGFATLFLSGVIISKIIFLIINHMHR